MYIENPKLTISNSVGCRAYTLKQGHLHQHENAVEVILVMNGEAKITVAFESHQLSKGEYLVVDATDFHIIEPVGEKYPEILSLYIELERIADEYPYYKEAWITCESFDLVRYFNKTAEFRELICSTAQAVLREEEDAEVLAYRCLETLLKHYCLRNYYTRGSKAAKSKTEKYYTIMKYILAHSERADLLDYISEKEHYSKSYITHLFKDVCGIAFYDLLTYQRLSKSLIPLLTTTESIGRISEKCGFSYVKFYTRDFKKWTGITPSEYRNTYQPLVDRPYHTNELACKAALKTLEKIKADKNEGRYSVSINPFAIKTWSADNVYLGTGVKDAEEMLKKTKVKDTAKVDQHACIIITDKNNISRQNTIKGVFSFEEAGYKTTLSLSYKDLQVNGCRETFKEILDILGSKKAGIMEISIIYNDLGDKQSVANLAAEGRMLLKSKDVKIMLMV